MWQIALPEKTIKMSIGKRLNLVIEYYNMNHNSFAKSLGMHNGSNIKRLIKLNRTPQITTVNKISEAYPNLNMDWLRTGDGTMIPTSSNNIDNEDLTLTAQQIYCKLDEDSTMYKDMLSNKLRDDRDYYDNDSRHSKDIRMILEGFKTLESKVEDYAVQASSSVIEKITNAMEQQTKLQDMLIDGLTKIKHLETDLEDIKVYMATNFELDKMNKKKSKQIKKLNPR